MKTFTRFLTSKLAFLMAQSQMQFEGLYSEGEGGAAWDADDSGAEPFLGKIDIIPRLICRRENIHLTGRTKTYLPEFTLSCCKLVIFPQHIKFLKTKNSYLNAPSDVRLLRFRKE